MSSEPSAAKTPAGCLEDRAVEELMSRDLLAVSAGESLVMAWELMRRIGVHHLPVIGPEGRCLGIVDAATVAANWESGGPTRTGRPVSDLLRKQAYPQVYPWDTVRAAAKAMATNSIDGIPVVDSSGELVGLLTARDLLAALAGMSPDEARAGVIPHEFASRRMLPREPETPPFPQFPPD